MSTEATGDADTSCRDSGENAKRQTTIALEGTKAPHVLHISAGTHS